MIKEIIWTVEWIWTSEKDNTISNMDASTANDAIVIELQMLIDEMR